MTAAHLVHELTGQAVEDGHVGIVAGVVSGDELAITSAGRTQAGGPKPNGHPNGHTVFRMLLAALGG